MATSDQTPAPPDKRADLAGRVCRLVHRHFPYCDHNQVNALVGQVWTEVQITLDQRLPAPATVDRDTLAEIAAERGRQDKRFGEQNHRDGTGSLDQVDLARIAKKWCEDSFGSGYGTWADVLAEEVTEACAERDPAKLRAELVQVAAVAVAWIEAIDRRKASAGLAALQEVDRG
ncbi:MULTISPECIES: hypothetical protein [unclassified Crossiella]|uniref:hypothetical protein n=1 Tax=unclassified Crossiella TaxID=2620835 RepID=UPI001FFF678B|nr:MULTISPECIES: hypothetical protein [unclassified Crossiella]MCK2242170.1 hypothetical protein [Crossiella sp. S99.2]MCK2256073.1 hypothetical protein [Crossiella sp. S99.1]